MHLRTVVRVTAACLALAACDSATGSRPLEGTYTLRTVGGRPVPATVDSVVWADGVTYTLDVLAGSSVEILSVDSARYTISERTMTHFPSGNFAIDASCITVVLQYHRRDDGLFLMIGPAQWGKMGRLRLEMLKIRDESLVLDTQNSSGVPMRLEYAASAQPVRCADANP
ncbi:MAG TPA: hypothetical protein VFT45_27915 [Longimicrobium sp.]|nr:hypothetical protein [Longimicrobium sp.]